MAKRGSKTTKKHKFRNKLLLNQWLISLFGIDLFHEYKLHGKVARPFHVLSDPIKDPRMEGLDSTNLHRFYYNLIGCELFPEMRFALSKDQLQQYEENIARHTMKINEKRHLPVVWKYFQWLTLLFTEIYLDRYFKDPVGLLDDLNEFVGRFNNHWSDYAPVPPYSQDDLNKLCLQLATGSGKTLIMHVNLLQYRHYAKLARRENELSRIILLTPNEALSEQHMGEFALSGIWSRLVRKPDDVKQSGLNQIDIMEITKLGDQEGPNTIATRSLGDQNLLLVDEGHRGMSGKEEGAWFTRRASLCAKGFTIEYSATFEQAIVSAKNDAFENSYAKSVLFDYSYRWFYEDGFGKDYQILNLPKSFDEMQASYLTACLLKCYQQLRIYQDLSIELQPFNLEKPLWVFVGSTVTKAKGSTDEKAVAADVAKIVQFVADFLADSTSAKRRIYEILTGKGQDTGLLDKDGNDIFAGSFSYLVKLMNGLEKIDGLYEDILRRLFNNAAGGQLELCRVKGDSGEIVLRVGVAEEPFGLINVGDAAGLCKHCEEVCKNISIQESEFTEAMFSMVKTSSSPVNLLIGSKKFVEGWDCWRVSTMGLMHVGRSEGTQIIQLFGRGVRLKGYEWSLKRSGHSFVPYQPNYIEDLETLNVFGIEADFMEKFRDFLKEEGLPGNERRQVFTIPLNVTYDFGKQLKILRPKRKASDGTEYDFKKDAPIPAIGLVPDYLKQNHVVADWYSRIQSVQSKGLAQAALKDKVHLQQEQLALLDYDSLFFDLERYKRERSWHNLNISKDGISSLLADPSWYTLYLPGTRLKPGNFDGVFLLQQVASELLRKYCDHYYNYCKRSWIEPRLELRELAPDDDIFPPRDKKGGYEPYQLVVDGDEHQLILSIQKIKKEIEENKEYLRKLTEAGDIKTCKWGVHLYQPLFHVRKGGKITVLPVVLNESEYQFVEDLKTWCDTNKKKLPHENTELFLLRNMSKGRGVGFFEAGNFHPDFILWMLADKKQYITFIEPHGLHHEGPGSEKVIFFERIKGVERRLNDPSVILNSFILSWTPSYQLKWGISTEEMKNMHVLFMIDDRNHYIEKLFSMIKE